MMLRVNRLSKFAVAVPCILALLGARPGRAETFIVKGGAANAEIVIADNPTRMQKFAARELQEYIKRPETIGH